MADQKNVTRVAKNTMFLFLRMVLVLGVGLYTSRVVLAILGVEDYGLYNLIGGVVAFFSFFQQALTNATHRFIVYDIGVGNTDNLVKTFSMAINVHVLLAFIVILLCEVVGLWFLNNKLVVPENRIIAAHIVFQLSILSFCLNLVRIPLNSVIIAYEHMNFYAYTSIVEVVLKLLIVYILSLFTIDKLILYSFLLLCISILLLLWYKVYCQKLFIFCRYKKIWDSQIFKRMINYSGWSVVVNGVDVSVTQSIVFFFNIFFGLVANAALGVANQVNGMLNQFLSTFTQAYNPQIIKSYAIGDKTYFIKLLLSTSKISFFLLLLLSVPILLNIDYILDIWLVNPPTGTSSFVVLIVIYSLIDAYSAPLWQGVHATGNIKTHQLLMASIKVINIPLVYLLLYNGASATVALVVKAFLNFVCSIVRPCYVRVLYGLPLKEYFIKVLGVIFIVVLLTVPLPLYISMILTDGILKLLITSSTYLFMAIPIIYFIGLSKQERHLITAIVLERIKLKK